MYKRPTPQDSDEDLLRLQEVFNRENAENKIKLAAHLISEKKEEKQVKEENVASIDIEEQLANTFEAIPNHKNLGAIIEKKTQSAILPQINFSTKGGFPTPKRRDAHLDSSQSGSIFSQQFKRVKKNENSSGSTPQTTFADQSYIITGSERGEIHTENLTKMKSMTEQEILEERDKLLATMDPAIIAFLKSRRNKEQKPENRNLTIKEQNEAAKDMEIDEIEPANQILKHPESDKWLNFKTIESTKLAWMKEIELPKIEKSESFEARFDFEGWVLPYSEKEITEKSRVLYHHGEEAGRPGYTLQELFQLSRSNVIQQKVVALNTIANILELQSTGVYDDVIELPTEQIFFVLRFCLDDNTPAVLNASIKAMRNLFYSKVDETCLDSLLGFGLGKVQPTLQVDNALEDDDRVNDQQLAETNLVKCLSRTEILTRIRYIINTVKPSVETIVYCMDILTRLARDSQFVVTKICKCDSLISSVVNNFVPNCLIAPNGVPLLQAIKFLRILSTRSQTIATDLVEKHKVIDCVMKYLSSENFSVNTNGLKLQTESLHLWSVFLHYGLTINQLQVFQPVLMEMLNFHLKNTNLHNSTTYVRHGHVSALLILIGSCRNLSVIQPYCDLIQNCAAKWFKQFMVLSEFTCGKLQIVSAMFICLASLLSAIDKNNLIFELLHSEGFKIVSNTLINGSMLLNNYEPHKTSPNLKSVEAAAWYTTEHIIPIIQSNSPIPFLSSVSNFVEACTNKNVKLAFLTNENIVHYLKHIRKREKYFLTSNWFTRIESNLIMNILKCSIMVMNDLDTRTYYEAAVKCLSIFTLDQKPGIEYILRNIVFSPKFYPSEVLIQNLSIDQRSNFLATSLNGLDEILQDYIRVLGLTDIPYFITNLSLELTTGNVIPIDWIYTPIIVLYSNQQQNKTVLDETEQVFTIRNCLRWIVIYESYFPELASCINATDRFCRLACVFLGSDNLFLIEEMHDLLKLCLINIIKCEPQVNFNREIQGLSSFEDFYTQLLEQYQGVSYGDVLFGNFVLFPLAQRHSIKFRKTLWSEYMGVVEIFNVTEENCLTPLDLFLTPNEDDLSLLKCYKRAIVSNSIRKHSVLYKIAKHHVEQYIAKKRNK